MNILLAVVLIVVMTGLGFLVGFFYRKRLMESHIESLEGLGKKILDEEDDVITSEFLELVPVPIISALSSTITSCPAMASACSTLTLAFNTNRPGWLTRPITYIIMLLTW